MTSDKKSVLFICLGNICRSPIAEAIFAHMVREKGLQDKWFVDSAALRDWNVGRKPDGRAQRLMEKHGIPMEHRAKTWIIDSAGTADYHIGKRPDKRALKCLRSHNVETEHRCREITQNDFKKYDIIFGMDDANMEDLEDIAPGDRTAQLKKLGEYDPKKQTTIEDPYYGEEADFEVVFQQCWRCCEEFLKQNS